VIDKINKGDDLVLPNGTVVRAGHDGALPEVQVADDDDTEDTPPVDEIPDPFEAGDGTFIRTLADVRVEPKQFNPVMLVLGYSLWGLDTHAIARFLELELSVVEAIQASELFSDTRAQLLEAIRYAESSSIHGYMTQKARRAAVVTAAALDHKSADIRLSAAKDILDRAGFRPADRTEHVHRFDDDLRIVVIKEDHHHVDIDIGV
jgi:hypothetical protein